MAMAAEQGPPLIVRAAADRAAALGAGAVRLRLANASRQATNHHARLIATVSAAFGCRMRAAATSWRRAALSSSRRGAARPQLAAGVRCGAAATARPAARCGAAATAQLSTVVNRCPHVRAAPVGLVQWDRACCYSTGAAGDVAATAKDESRRQAYRLMARAHARSDEEHTPKPDAIDVLVEQVAAEELVRPLSHSTLSTL